MELDELNADSLVDMIKMSFVWENWDAILEISDRLFELAAITYDSSQYGLDNHKQPLKKSIVYYFGYSMCMKGMALQKLGKMPESRKCINQYSDLGWIKNLDKEALAEVEYYKNIAAANTYVVHLLEGHADVLADYVEFIRNCDEEELLAGLITVLESSIKFNYSVDWVLEEFNDQVEELSLNAKQEDVRYYMNYRYLKAIYLYKRNRVNDAINLILDILKISDNINDVTGFRKTIAFYEIIRNHSSILQQEIHQDIIKNILEREFLKDEKNNLVTDRCIVD